MPRFLNGHYVTWPAKGDIDGTTSYCDADGTQPKPPPHIYYVPDNVVFTRMQMAGDRAFIVSPRYKPGVPFTLGYVPLTDCPSTSTVSNNSLNTEHKRNNDDGYHPVTPYPSLYAHCQFTKQSTQYKGKESSSDSECLVNVVDVYLGPDGILWILDIGIVNTLPSPDSATKPTKYNDPKVLGIDVTTGITVHKIMLGTLLKPIPNDEDKLKLIARSLCSIVVEYDDNSDKDTVAGKSRTQKRTRTGDNGMTKKVMRDKRSTQDKWEDGSNGIHDDCRNECDVCDSSDNSKIRSNNNGNGSGRCNRKCSRSSEDDPPIVRNRRHSNDTSSANKPKPVAVYVGDACIHDRFKGLIVVWLVDECRGIRVILPASVSATEDDDSCDGDLDPSRNTLHMALLDDFGGRQRQRHLYFTYGRNPDAFRIPVTAFRDHGTTRKSVDLKLTSCPSTGSNQCVMNVGRKPISGGGSVGRPLVPVDSAYGMQWYFRDPAAIRRSDLYVWDARRRFHSEYFDMIVRSHVTRVASVQHSGRSCVTSVRGLPPGTRYRRDTGYGKEMGRGKDTEHGKETSRGKEKGHGKNKGHGKGTGRGKDTGCGTDYGCNDDDDDPCESCNSASDALIKNGTDGGLRRPSGGRLSPGCMEITSVDYASTKPTSAAKDGYVLWALHSNIQDWVHGQTGRFGMTALLCPIVCNTAGD
eukprot:XP_008180698.1 PREDICTED: uncharacterized protein LOC100574059 [Acyrthosiphon pisum]